MRPPVKDVNVLKVGVEFSDVCLRVPSRPMNENQKSLRKIDVPTPRVIVRRVLAGESP